jgi:hypothetical protein
MSDPYPPAAQRPRLLAFADALGCRDAALRRDECGDWRIKGQHGHVASAPEGFQLYYGGPEFIGTARGWGFAKRAFEAFGAKVTQDGDDEGVVVFGRLPTPAEAEVIRDKLKIAKKREISDAERERLRSMGNRFQSRNDVVGETSAPDPNGEADWGETPAR